VLKCSALITPGQYIITENHSNFNTFIYNHFTMALGATSDLIGISAAAALEMLRDGEPLQKILTTLVEAAEAISGRQSVSSIMVVDKQGLLRNAASTGLPSDYLAAIDGIRPDPGVGTCAAAAATGKIVITEDFTADDKWVELRHLPLALGFQSAWSMPIRNKRQEVLGTFGTYFRECRRPAEWEIDSVAILAEAAAKVLTVTNAGSGQK
jgi:GAF domain-containing protein